MNLGDIRTRLINIYGNTLSSETAFLNQCINDAYDKVCARADWWWLEREAVLNFKAITTTQTSLTLTNLSTAVTLNPSLGTDYDNGWFFTGSQTYRITDASTAITLLDGVIVDTTTTAGTMTAWNDILALPGDFDEVAALYCRNDPNHLPLREVSMEDIEKFGPDVSTWDSEWGDRFAVGRDNDLAATFFLRIFPPPESHAQYTLRYRCNPTALSSDSDIPLIPAKHHVVLVDRAKIELLKATYEYPDVVRQLEMEYERGIARMLADRGKDSVQYRLGRRGALMAEEPIRFKTTNTSAGI